MAEQQYQLGNTERYLNFGDRRPPETRLFSMLERVGSTRNGGSDLIAADMCIDIAAWEPDTSEERIADANAWLSGVIVDTLDMKAEGYNTAVMEENAVAAYLRQWELPNWQRAITGNTPQADYAGALKMSHNILTLITDDRHNANNILREFMLVLIGMRAESRQLNQGWMGRLALCREDCRPVISEDCNANWDTAVWREGSAGIFMEPPNKWQVKTTRSIGAARYARAGIKVIKASSRGFRTPRSIMAGCIVEAGVDVDTEQTTPYSTEQLDDITMKISDRLFEEHDEAVA